MPYPQHGNRASVRDWVLRNYKDYKNKVRNSYPAY